MGNGCVGHARGRASTYPPHCRQRPQSFMQSNQKNTKKHTENRGKAAEKGAATPAANAARDGRRRRRVGALRSLQRRHTGCRGGTRLPHDPGFRRAAAGASPPPAAAPERVQGASHTRQETVKAELCGGKGPPPVPDAATAGRRPCAAPCREAYSRKQRRHSRSCMSSHRWGARRPFLDAVRVEARQPYIATDRRCLYQAC